MESDTQPLRLPRWWLVIAGCWFLLVSLPLLYFCSYWYVRTPSSSDLVLVAVCAALSFLFGALFWWIGFCSEKGKRNGGSVGFATSFSLLPFFFSFFLTGGIFIVATYVLAGYLLSLASYVYARASAPNPRLQSDAVRTPRA